MNLAILCIGISIFSTGFAVVSEITLYDEINNEGNSVTFKGKYPDLTAWTFFLQKAKSHCVIGWLHFYDDLDFDVAEKIWGSGFNTMLVCVNQSDFSPYKSARVMGPPDTTTPSLAIYKGSPNFIRGGEEILFTGSAANNFPFQPTQIVTFGNSDWTLFTENNFSGNSWCLPSPNSSAGYVNYSTNSTHPVRSIIRGCGQVDLDSCGNRRR